MAEVILSSDDLTVLGGPSVVSVDVDFGPTGDRGSQIFVGNGNPNIVEIGQTPKIFDLYINLLSSDEEYLNYYQYQNVDGVPVWVRLFDLVPFSKSNKTQRDFTDGVASFTIPVSNIVSNIGIESLTSSNFNVQYSIYGENPIASSITLGDPSLILDVLSLPITITASEYLLVGESLVWQPLNDESRLIDLFITMV
jgi:hypothetical protein